MSWYVEWTPKTETRQGTMVPVADVDQYIKWGLSGYTSVYMFNEPSAETIKQSRRSRNFKLFKAYSECLIMDCDRGEEYRDRIETYLQRKGYKYSVWFSGSKGHHFYLPMSQPLFGHHTPYSQKAWVIEQGLSDLVDMSLYRASSLISAPGRVHPKTGKKKTLLYEKPGAPIVVPYKEPPSHEHIFTFEGPELQGFELAMQQVGALAEQPDVGYRHTRIWSTAERLSAAGCPFGVAYGLLSWINSQWADPKPEDEVLKAVEQGYRGRG